MDFFNEQRTRTRRSLLLYGLFFLIVLAHVVVGLWIMALLLTIFTGGIYQWVLILVIIWTLFSFIAGSFVEYQRLKAGGRAIAKRVGAVRLFIDNSHDAWVHSQGVAHQHQSVSPVLYTSRHIAVRHERDFPPTYKRYYEFAQQLAIASGLSMPILYVLPEEQGINGFVAGRYSEDMVLVVTQGALDKLSDEALYGLIGHEYGHILHGDAKFNLQLMVVLAGLQLLYDWSDSTVPVSEPPRAMPSAQREVDAHARSIEAQTAEFSTHSEWVRYWQAQAHSQNQNSYSAASSLLIIPRIGMDSGRHGQRNIGTLLLHGLSFSSMVAAQLIKHSFNRERELLADATSVQLTRSPAILETLKAIHQDPLGSRLSNIADINGLSHFFFASSGSDLGDVSWLATHPSVAERMSAVNANDYQDFALQVARQKRLNQKKIKEIYEQRRRVDWGDSPVNKPIQSHKKTIMSGESAKRSTTNGQEAVTGNLIKQSAAITAANHTNIVMAATDIGGDRDSDIANDMANKIANERDSDVGLTFTASTDVVINGRLEVEATDSVLHKVLKPWQAALNSDLPIATLITDLQQLTLSHYLLNHSHHPLGAQALIEAVLLCHQNHALSTRFSYDLTDVWCGLPKSFTTADSSRSSEILDTNANVNASLKGNNQSKILAHTLDFKLLENVASLDRRLDSALIIMAVNRLRKHDLSQATLTQLQQQSALSHSFHDHQHYQQQQKSRMMLLRYQQGLIELINSQLTHNLAEQITNPDKKPINTRSSKSEKKAQSRPILSLWQALHLQQLLPVLSQVLGNGRVGCDTLCTDELNDSQLNTDKSHHDKPLESASYTAILQIGLASINTQLDPSGQVFAGLSAGPRLMLILIAYRLARDERLQNQMTDYKARYVIGLRRHARLIDIDLRAVSDANLHWLLLTAQCLNSVQLLAIIESVSGFVTLPKSGTPMAHQADNKPQSSSQIAYNSYRLWLSSLHTVMLHDTIISQDEYDCLTLLAERWLGVRQLVD
ncbi:M48 family metalloprotease [Psychrobacter frigidicola]|uniref:M48 family metalloprotease n=1 Tax=Psychrobacter frigidicola TaxID=45611 RepID=A0A5C7A8D6_9GAMM|nr:M48 family metalloprotease [Psychrobacter frigidicola]TXD97966.1 M48 family metalloprotease [Psychrobacter frigidicola]